MVDCAQILTSAMTSYHLVFRLTYNDVSTIVQIQVVNFSGLLHDMPAF